MKKLLSPQQQAQQRRRRVREEKDSTLSFEEKRVLSEQINELPPDKLTRVLNIISESMLSPSPMTWMRLRLILIVGYQDLT